jgi:hypothetical protein
LSAAIKALLSDKELRQKVLNAGIELTFSNSPAEFLAFRAQPGGDAVIRTIGLKLVCLASHRASPAGMPRRGCGSPGFSITAQTRTAWSGYGRLDSGTQARGSLICYDPLLAVKLPFIRTFPHGRFGPSSGHSIFRG